MRSLLPLRGPALAIVFRICDRAAGADLQQIWITEFFFIFDFFLRLYFCGRVIQRRLPVGVAWAWICLILFLPLFGTIVYFYLGEYRLGRRRRLRLEATTRAIRQLSGSLVDTNQDSSLPEPSRTFARAVQGFFHSALLSENDIELLRDADEAFTRLLEDIDQAHISCDMVFYIWSDGGRADDFGAALIRAAQRGVRCRVLVDQIGSAAFLQNQMAKKLRRAGVELVAAMPSGFIRSIFARPDLRIHRKILVIDGKWAYTGSLNLADPLFFKRDAQVGQWVDAFCRLQGSAVRALALVFLSDWCVENALDFQMEEAKLIFQDTAVKRQTQVQCLPSGPAVHQSSIEEVLIMAIYAAQKKLTLTTPYFVPSEAFLSALIASARRGVDVTLIIPEKVDSQMINYASRPFLRDLIEAGVQVALYQGGLLHTKSVFIDGGLSIFGSLNLDPRSLRINFEITLAIYDRDFAQAIESLQNRYLQKAKFLDLATCDSQGWRQRFIEDFARLAGPLL